MMTGDKNKPETTGRTDSAGKPDDRSSSSPDNTSGPEQVRTRDGSMTLYSHHYGQHYHNLAGAWTESRHVFFEQTGLLRAIAGHRNVTVFETGYGSGFHLLLLELFRRSAKSRSNIYYAGVEKYPVSGDMFRSMQPGKIAADLYESAGTSPSVADENADLANEELADAIAGFNDRQCRAETGSVISVTLSGDPPDSARSGTPPPEQAGTDRIHTGSTTATVYRGDFSDLKSLSSMISVNRFDFFLHDAFSPAANPDLWTTEVFSKLLDSASDRAMLGTYCSATKARAAMVLAGWHVARAAGPPGKREMTLASPSEEALSGFKRVNEQRLRDRFQKELTS
ncbi:tRNA (5-methylaminomethyl-2-thiouridine)(34)-methyltransferase MnmD [Natronogracilivirga saccharolytica]|uniref:MnmC-like methyltransferase domain-containing protein n=1 Tax=Natronogracilivirga saccharolytica TaxID=2812953 RepID=A0A8J7UT09_9BACT|nr:MnmC family methyltransferase [Natronogracilivirga saccharolytica]MBP3192126.1 hypothetical protein [Natronogracilivirga saccharolytica]